MNIRLKRNFLFHLVMVYDDKPVVNTYELSIKFLTMSEDGEKQNIVYDRVKYWIDHVLANSLIISEKSSKVEAFRSAGFRVMAMPSDPVDQVIGIMLYSKLNAIMEDIMVITDIEICSDFGDNMWYLHSSNEAVLALESPAWWTDSRPCWSNSKKRRPSSKVIELDRMPEWSDLDLDLDPVDDEDHSADVVFADFVRNEEK